MKILSALILLPVLLLPLSLSAQGSHTVTVQLPVTVKQKFTLVVTPPAPTITCETAPGTVVAGITVQGGSGNPVALTISGDTTDFALSATTVPANIVVAAGGIALTDCGVVNNVTITGTQQ